LVHYLQESRKSFLRCRENSESAHQSCAQCRLGPRSNFPVLRLDQFVTGSRATHIRRGESSRLVCIGDRAGHGYIAVSNSESECVMAAGNHPTRHEQLCGGRLDSASFQRCSSSIGEWDTQTWSSPRHRFDSGFGDATSSSGQIHRIPRFPCDISCPGSPSARAVRSTHDPAGGIRMNPAR
jgi:hypothetical protein